MNRIPTIREIQHIVADRLGIPVIEMRSRRKTARPVEARQLAMWLARQMTLASLPEIGREFDRDHTTVMHAIRKVDTSMKTDRRLVALVGELRQALTCGPTLRLVA